MQVTSKPALSRTWPTTSLFLPIVPGGTAAAAYTSSVPKAASALAFKALVIVTAHT